MSWKDDFKMTFDRVYEIMQRKYPDISFPCYGGRFYWFLITRHFTNLYFYLTQNSLIYTTGSAYITEIPFDTIRKLSVKQGFFVRSSIHIRMVADRRHHLIIKRLDYLSTKITGDGINNIDLFIETLQSKVGRI